MLPKIAVLADYANVADGSKLNVMGVFTILHATSVPVLLPQMVVVAQFECEPADAGEKSARVALNDADGQELFRLSSQVVIPRDQEGYPALYNQVLVMNNLVLPAFGPYVFQLFIDDEWMVDIPWRVAPIASPAQTR
jgi:hypothetical protein